MDTRDYEAEIASLAGQKRFAGVCRFGVGVQRALLKPVVMVAGHSAARDRLAIEAGNLDARRGDLAGRIAALRRQHAEVVSREGHLFRCASCQNLCRTGFGGQLTKDELMYLNSACGGWLCGACHSRFSRNAEAIAVCYGTFIGIFNQDRVPGSIMKADRGWITTAEEHESIECARQALRLSAARLLANACVSFWWKEHRERVLAGHGPRGNPFYQTQVTYSATARAVVAEPLIVGRGTSGGRR